MLTPKNSLGVIVLIAAFGIIYRQPIQYALAYHHVIFFLIIHLAIAVLIFLTLQIKFKRLTSFVGSSVFVLYPGHAYMLACGRWSWGRAFIYLLCIVAAVVIAAVFERLLVFLKSQEKIVRDLFKVAIAALILGMAVFSLQINNSFKDLETLWRFRAKQVGGSYELTQLADILRNKTGDKKEDEIIGLYKQAIKKDGHYSLAYLNLASFFDHVDKKKEAIAILKQLIEKNSRDNQAYFSLAGLYQNNGDAKDAIEVYNALLKIDPDEENNYVRIIEAYGEAIKKYPKQTIYQEKREELLAAYEQFSKRKTYTASDYYNLGFLYQQVGGSEEAMRFYRKSLALDPKYEKSLYSLANLYQASGDVRTALGLYEKLLTVNSRSTLTYLNMGIIYNALGDTVRARLLYQKVIALDPNNADAYFNLGYLSETAGELREAINFYEKAVEKNSKHAEAYYNMGNVYASLDQQPEAIAAYLKTVAINPNHLNAYVNLSILSFKAKDFQGAIRYLDEAQLLGYTPPEAYLKTLELYRKK